MSLDVTLTLEGAAVPAGSGIFVREGGRTVEISRQEWDARNPGREPVVLVRGESDTVFSRNITHNLGTMAEHAGLYRPLWRPEELGITTAAELVEPLRAGLRLLNAEPEHYRRFNPENGWGNYEALVEFCEQYLAACERYPAAKVAACR